MQLASIILGLVRVFYFFRFGGQFLLVRILETNQFIADHQEEAQVLYSNMLVNFLATCWMELEEKEKNVNFFLLFSRSKENQFIVV